MRTVMILINKTDSDWGTDIVEMEVPSDVCDAEIEDALAEGKENAIRNEMDRFAATPEINDRILNDAAEKLGGTWGYCRQILFEYTLE